MNSIFKLLVFDWDGTLMDSAQRILNCMKSAASDMEAAPRTDDQFLNIIVKAYTGKWAIPWVKCDNP